ncbi:hypothetical protein BH10PSE13_BH10PSE13_23490 [soil metagenome]
MRFAFGRATCTLGLLMVMSTAAVEAGPLRERLRERMTQRMAERAEADKPEGGMEMAYGTDPAQKLAFWKGASTRAPLILFVHGGGWRMGSKENATGKTKVAHLTGEGYALASIDYRLVPAATVEQQASDVAAATAYAVKNADRLGIDPARIILMGHSAGAHLVALIGTDPAWLKAAGLPMTAVRGGVARDGAAYEVPTQMAEGPEMMQKIYAQAFGTDAARERALSPTLHAAAPNAPAFLILHVQREDGIRQSEALAAALRKAGTDVSVQGFDGKGLRGHMEMNRRLGDPDYPATAALDGWLKQRFQ